MDFEKLFTEKNRKLLMVVPAVLFIVFLFLIFAWPTVPRGIDLQGGSLILIRSDKPIDALEVKQILSENFDLLDLKVSAVSSPGSSGVNVQFAGHSALPAAESQITSARDLLKSNPAAALQNAQAAVESMAPFIETTELPAEPENAVAQAEAYLLEANESLTQQMQELIVQRFGLGENIAFQRKEVSPTLSASFWQTALNVAITAAILIIIVVFLFFRKVVPSLAVIAAAVFDVAGAMALMAVFGIPLSLSSIPALLMLVGYSVDTDIMLTTRVLQRREKTPSQRAADAMSTGLTMTFTTIAALVSMIIISYMGQIFVIFEIASVILFGLIADLVSTWLMNSGILLWYAERQQKASGF